MTNKEIKLELARVALERCGFFTKGEELTDALNRVYEWIIKEPEEEITPEPVSEQPVKVDYEQKSIDEVYDEMQFIEEEEKLEKKRAGYRNVQKKGHAVRFWNAARFAEIETVGQLIAYGKADFMRLRNIGINCADQVSIALKKLYGIEKW